MPVLDASSPLEDSVTADARIGKKQQGDQATVGDVNASANAPDDDLLSDASLLQLARASDRQSINFAQQNYIADWDRNYRSFRSEHFAGSKYNSDEYRNRSRLFRPKTRSFVVKDLAAAAGSLFATVDAVTTSPGDETDPMQVANAAVQQELINYRLDRTSGRNSIPWFLTAMGARQDATITGICCSKQYWDYRSKMVSKTDPQTGEKVQTKKIVLDKPCIELFPAENIGLHPAAHWMDPVNDGAYFTAWYPMVIGDIKAMMTDDRFPWRDVSDEAILKSRVVMFDETAQVRRAREGGKDRLNDMRSENQHFDVCWVCERFIRIEDEDYCFWTLGNQKILSDAIPTEEAYPAFGGERPYKIGYGALESHRIVPQSNVSGVQPIQQEINDLVNLRLDNVKEALKPLTLIKRGKKVDIDRLRRRGQNTTVLVDDPEGDIKFDRPTDVSGSSYTEMERLNVDFDDLTGLFNSGTVQTNRSLNETVGGMKLLSGAANSITEFNIRIWVETWVEPVLAQIAKLESYYESDQKVLAIAKKRANLFQRFGMSEITDEMLQEEVFVRVSAGVGSPDPMQKLAKMTQAIGAFTPIASASKEFQAGTIVPNLEEFANEIFGYAGIRDAFDRLFKPGQPAPPPGGAQPQGKPPQELAAEQQDHAAERSNKLDIEKLKSRTAITRDIIKHRADHKTQHRDLRNVNKHKFLDILSEALAGHSAQLAGAADSGKQQVSESINFKDLPPDGKVQMAKQAGLTIKTPAPEPKPAPAAKAPAKPQTPSNQGNA